MVAFTKEQLTETLVAIAEWCEDGGFLSDLIDPSDLYEQFKFLVEVKEAWKGGRKCTRAVSRCQGEM